MILKFQCLSCPENLRDADHIILMSNARNDDLECDISL